mgnify:FL=1
MDTAKLAEGLFLALDALMEWYWDEKEARAYNKEAEEEEDEDPEGLRYDDSDGLSYAEYVPGELFSEQAITHKINAYDDESDVPALEDMDILALALMYCAAEFDPVDLARGFGVELAEVEDFVEVLPGTLMDSQASSVMRAYRAAAVSSDTVTVSEWAAAATHLCQWYALAMSFKASTKIATPVGQIQRHLATLFATGRDSEIPMDVAVREAYQQGYENFIKALVPLAQVSSEVEEGSSTLPLSKERKRGED